MTRGAAQDQDSAQVFARAAEVFALLGTPQRLRILSLLCEREMNVGELRAALGGPLSSVSQSLATLYRSGVLARRHEGASIFYCVDRSHSLMLCDAVRSMVGRAAGD